MKKILFLCAHSPFEIYSGAHQRTNLLCRALSEIGEVDIFCLEKIGDLSLVGNPIPNCSVVYSEQRNWKRYPFWINLLNNVKQLLFFFSQQILTSRNKNYAKKLAEIMKAKDYDYIVVRYITMAIQCGLPYSKKVIIDLDDLPQQVYKTEKMRYFENNIKRMFRSYFYAYMEAAAKVNTKRIVKKVKCVFVPDKSLLNLFFNANYLPNIPYPTNKKIEKSTHYENNANVLFVGRLSYEPNYYGINHFLECIWPIVIESIPQVQFNIVGIEILSECKKIWQQYPGVNIVGYVEDIFEEYEKNNVVVVPVYLGAGTNIKVLEAMSLSKACVISKYACRGFEDFLLDGKNVFIANDDKDFADKIIQLLKDKDLNQNIGINAQKIIENKYSYDHFRQVVHQAII